MGKQTLSIEQMQHLKELGLELKETVLYWGRCVDNNPRAATHYGEWVLTKGNSAQTVGLMHWEFVPAYTLQDVLEELPKFIINEKKELAKLIIDFGTESIGYFFNKNENGPDSDKQEGPKREGIDTLIDAAYELLCWCIENGYINIKEQSKEDGTRNRRNI